jgi:tetratricopeptide (TPR) repeat protein
LGRSERLKLVLAGILLAHGSLGAGMSYGSLLGATPPPQLAPAETAPAQSRAAVAVTPSNPAPGKGVRDRRATAEQSQDTKEEASLLALIAPGMPPRRVASLRLAEEGRKLLQSGDYRAGLTRLEKAIALDSANAYAYFYIARAHFHLSQYQQSLNFLEIVEPSLGDKPSWLSRVYALEGENYRAMGSFDSADRKYLEALSVDAFNRVALDGLISFPEESPPLR